MAHTFLLEIGLEEMPAHVVTPSIKQLVQKPESISKNSASALTILHCFQHHAGWPFKSVV